MQLYAQIDELRREVAQRGVEVQASRQDLLAEVDAKVCCDILPRDDDDVSFPLWFVNLKSFCYLHVIISMTYYAQRKLTARVEELMAFLDRTKKFQGSDPDSATNTEYLKNCVYRFMAAREHSERRRLAPVISTILKLTSQEQKAIDTALLSSEANDIGEITTSVASSLFGFWSDSTTSHR